MWQDVRNELHPLGLEVVTIAMDVGGLDAARSFIEYAKPEHPSLIDQAHLLGELFGVVNVPSGIWINEEGVIVRVPEPAWPGEIRLRKMIPAELPEGLDPYLVETMQVIRDFHVNPKGSLAALKDWAANGALSPFALSPAAVVERSRARTPEAAQAAAHFELGQHLFREGARDDAFTHFKAARRLQPDNWTYKRQAWSFANPMQAPSDEMEGDYVTDVVELGPETYYPKLDV